jgi:DNA replication protein DnaC
MLLEQTFEKLYSLKLHGMAQALERQQSNPDLASLAFEERLGMLVEEQWLWRENRALKSRLRLASLKIPSACMEDINYRHPRQLDGSMFRSLGCCDWIRNRHNVTITGPAGVGKTYLCCALLQCACRHGFSARYLSAPKLFRQLAMAYADGSFDRLLSRLAKTDVIAIDDWGLAPLTDTQKHHILEVLDDRCGSGSTILGSQYEVEKWHDLVVSPTLADALMERMLTNSYRLALKGETLRPVKRSLNRQPRSGGKEDE